MWKEAKVLQCMWCDFCYKISSEEAQNRSHELTISFLVSVEIQIAKARRHQTHRDGAFRCEECQESKLPRQFI